jgi:hypothetical protein
MAATRFSKRGRLVLLAALAALTLGLILATRFDAGLLMLMPAVAIVAVFVARPYAGLELIVRIAAGRRRHSRRHRSRPPVRRTQRRFARGGRLIATALGGRAPPLLPGRP